ncbi:MAG: DUF1592 domain-containing protein [Planctomycetota bacterium]|nr:DUF1592 domain-containing protein [Planctomycetota bacterium]
MTSRPEPFGSTWAGSFLENIDQSTLCDAQCLMARPFPPAYIQTMSFRNISIILAILLPIGIAAESAIPKRLGAFVEKHCVDCHEGAEANSGLDFYKLGFDLSKEETARRWILVYDRLLKGEMPPPKKRRPEADESKAILKLLAESITESEQERTQVVLRRLNRREYENTSRDLFQADVSVKGLPDDTSTDGFDNVGEGLAVSAEAMQAYLEAADQVLDAVFSTPEKPKFIRHETNLLKQVDWKGRPQLESQIGKMFRKTDDGLVIFQSYYCPTNLVNFARMRAPAGTYRGKIRVRAIQSDKPVTMRIYGGDTIVNRRECHLVGYFDVPPNKWSTIEFVDRLVEDSGTFLPKCYGTEDTRKDADTYPNPGIEIGDIVIEGPIDEWPPKSRALLLGDLNLKSANVEDAEAIIVRLLPRAFRRPVEPIEAKPYVELFSTAFAKGRPFESALRISLKAILCSPEFLFLDEPGKRDITPEAFASRLSYFLWSSMPDTELTELAAAKKLGNPEVLYSQVERMLKDPRARSFTENFTGQWLSLRDINFTEPDPNLYPEFDELLRNSMVSETKLFFQEILDRDFNIMNFVDSDFTFLNGRLAKHYGIDGVEGQEFRKVTLPSESLRGGLLTQASILKVTANGTYTSPVLRGVWVLDKIMGQPTSPPPDNVGSVEPDTRGATTIREQLAKHRNVKSCAACHTRIDPPGFALESFDPIGGLRTNYRTMAEEAKRPTVKRAPFTWAWVRYRIGLPVDATGEMPTGEAFSDVRKFKQLLSRNPDQLTRNLTQKLLTYALGRKIGFSDRPAVEEIVRQAREKEYGFRSLVHVVAQSEVFRKL